MSNETRAPADERLPEDRSDEVPREGRARTEHRLRDFARRILPERNEKGEREKGDREIQFREAVVALLETGDRAKTEMIRLLAREFRSYLTELKVGDGLHYLLTNYSLEVHASLNLKPLVEKPEKAEKQEKKEKVEKTERPKKVPEPPVVPEPEPTAESTEASTPATVPHPS